MVPFRALVDRTRIPRPWRNQPACCVFVVFHPASLPCGVPTKADAVPSGGLWIREIKHDGFRVIARKTGNQVRLYSRPGTDFTRRSRLIAEAIASLRSQSCILDDGEAVICDNSRRLLQGRWHEE